MLLNEIINKVVAANSKPASLEKELATFSNKDAMFTRACEIIDSEWEEGLLNKIKALRPDLSRQFDTMFEDIGESLSDDLVSISSFASELSKWVQFSTTMCLTVKEL